MQYGLTKSVIERGKYKGVPAGGEIDWRFVWEVNYALICGKKLLIIVNPDTRYSIICSDIKAKTWNNLLQFIHSMIESAMIREGFTEQEIERYFVLAGEETITKTHGRVATGGLNHVTTYLTYIEKWLVDGTYQTIISDTMNDDIGTLATHPEERYIVPKEFFHKRFKELLCNE